VPLLQSRAQGLSADPSRDQAAGASLVAISPEKPDDTLSTAEKNALDFEVLSDAGQKVGRAFGLVYTFSDELKSAYREFGLDIPGRNGADEWALPISATYAIRQDEQLDRRSLSWTRSAHRWSNNAALGYPRFCRCHLGNSPNSTPLRAVPASLFARMCR